MTLQQLSDWQQLKAETVANKSENDALRAELEQVKKAFDEYRKAAIVEEES